MNPPFLRVNTRLLKPLVGSFLISLVASCATSPTPHNVWQSENKQSTDAYYQKLANERFERERLEQEKLKHQQKREHQQKQAQAQKEERARALPKLHEVHQD